MSLLKPKQKIERAQYRINLDAAVLAEVKQYCDYAGFKKLDDFFEEAAIHIFSRDKAYKEWKERHSPVETSEKQMTTV